MKAVEFNRKAESAFKRGDHKQTLNFYGEALRIDRSVENTDGIAINLINMASVYRMTGEKEKAHKCLEELLAPSPIAHRPLRLSRAAFMKAVLSLDEGKYDAAAEWAVRAAAFCRDDECPFQGSIYNLQSRLALLRNDTGSAVRYGNEGLELNKKFADREETANSLRLLADARVSAGEYAAAIKAYEEALALDKSLGLGRKTALDLTGLGNALSGLGRHEEAVKYYQRALSSFKSAGDEQGAKDAASKIETLRQKNK